MDKPNPFTQFINRILPDAKLLIKHHQHMHQHCHAMTNDEINQMDLQRRLIESAISMTVINFLKALRRV